jgi:hypothetical protein
MLKQFGKKEKTRCALDIRVVRHHKSTPKKNQTPDPRMQLIHKSRAQNNGLLVSLAVVEPLDSTPRRLSLLLLILSSAMLVLVSDNITIREVPGLEPNPRGLSLPRRGHRLNGRLVGVWNDMSR